MTPPAYRQHPEYRAHLAGIRANPEDDLPRLVLADWLDEQQGGYSPRAEFIRNDCERGVWHRFPPGRTPAITIHEKEPPQTRRVGIDVPTDDSICYDTHRGFINVVELPFELWVRYADLILPESVDLYLKLTTWRRADTLERWTNAPWDHTIPIDVSRPPYDRPRRYCRIIGRSLVHEIPHTNATNADYEKVIRTEWPEVAAVELPRVVSAEWNTNTTDIAGQLRTAHEEILRDTIRSFAVPEHLLRGEPESLTEVRRQLRQVRDAQRQYAYHHGGTRFTRNGAGESVTYIPDNEYMQMEAYARELENEIVRNTGRRDF